MVGLDDRQEYRLNALVGWIIWSAFGVILTLVISRHIVAGERTVVPSYRLAAQQWVSSEPIYQLDSVHGFLYLPSSAGLMAPMAWLPEVANEVLWRWLMIGLLGWATWRLSGALSERIGRGGFVMMTLMIAPVCAGSASSGQMNLVLAATMALGTAEVIERRWWWATFWLGLGLALKPQALVLVLVLGVVCPPMRWRSLIAIGAALAVPFVLQSPGYVMEQYRLCWLKMGLSSRPGDVGVRNSDLFGLLGIFGIELQERWHWVLRLVTAPLTLWLCWVTVGRRERLLALNAVLGFSACYLMLFNPRTEGGSYVVAAMPLAACAVWALHEGWHWGRVAILGVITFGWMLSYNLSLGLWLLAKKAGLDVTADFRAGYWPYWLSPLLCVVFLIYLVWMNREKMIRVVLVA